MKGLFKAVALSLLVAGCGAEQQKEEGHFDHLGTVTDPHTGKKIAIMQNTTALNIARIFPVYKEEAKKASDEFSSEGCPAEDSFCQERLEAFRSAHESLKDGP